MDFDLIRIWFEKNFIQLLYFLGIMILAVVVYIITKKYILTGITKLIKKSKTSIDDLFFDKKLLNRIAYIAPLVIIYNFAYLFPIEESIIKNIIEASIALILLLTFGAFLTVLNLAYEKRQYAQRKPIKGYIQVLKIIVYIIGIIIIITNLLGQDISVLLGGLGAMTAVILLIFRDTILSFVASLQISSADLVRMGDWLEIPAFGADGDVIDIALHTIKVQNWDKTITVIPTHKLIEVSFKNWRGMKLSGGRRIKRAIYIDQNSIKFCDQEMLDRFERMRLISDYIKTKKEEIAKFNKEHGIEDGFSIHRRRLTNIGTFRAYVEAYINKHEKIHQGLTHMVRQLPPGPNGLPLEIYVFTNDTIWTRYEAIQSDIFDHILAVIPEFELRIFQNPSGQDFSKIKN